MQATNRETSDEANFVNRLIGYLNDLTPLFFQIFVTLFQKHLHITIIL